MIHLIKKFHPKLRQILQDDELKVMQIGSEQEIKELWDASNPDMPYKIRGSGNYKHTQTDYPIDTWFGVIHSENGKARLVSIAGHAIRTGKEGKPFAYVGGNKTHPDYQKRGLMRIIRNKNLEAVGSIPKVAQYTKQGKERLSSPTLSEPQEHEVVPDLVIEQMKRRVREIPVADSWGIFKNWKDILRR